MDGGVEITLSLVSSCPRAPEMTESSIFRCDENSSFHAGSIVQPTALDRRAVCEELKFKRRRYSDAWLLRSSNVCGRCAIVRWRDDWFSMILGCFFRTYTIEIHYFDHLWYNLYVILRGFNPSGQNLYVISTRFSVLRCHPTSRENTRQFSTTVIIRTTRTYST